MAIDKASLMIVEGNKLPDATTVASLAILLGSSGVTQMPKMPGPKVRVVATNTMDVKAVVVVMVMFIGRLVAGPILWMPMSSRGIQLISLEGIN